LTKNNPLHVAFAHRVEQSQTVNQVVVIVARRVLTRFADQRVRRHVDDGFDPVGRESFSKRRGISEVRVHKLSARGDGFAVAFVEIVIDNNLMAVRQQFFSDDAADVTGAACY
jgi:hypothetical protein